MYICREMFTQKEQDEIINDFLDVAKVSDYIRELKKNEIVVNVRIVRNMIVIALYTNYHCQKILLIISMALLIGVGHAKRPSKKRKH